MHRCDNIASQFGQFVLFCCFAFDLIDMETDRTTYSEFPLAWKDSSAHIEEWSEFLEYRTHCIAEK